MAKFMIKEKLDCLKRELGLRKRNYPRWVSAGTMSQQFADEQIALMEELVKEYEVLEENERAQLRMF